MSVPKSIFAKVMIVTACFAVAAYASYAFALA